MIAADAAQNPAERLDAAVLPQRARPLEAMAAIAAMAGTARHFAVMTVTWVRTVGVAMAMPVTARPGIRGRCRGGQEKKRKQSRNVPHNQGFRRGRMNRE
jgi:hypothetical protein